jgi:hypothetical protein
MAGRGQVNLGDAVRYRLPDGTSRYGIVERIRPASSSTAGVQVAFPAIGVTLAPTHVNCDPGVLQPLADAELHAFLAANIDRPMSDSRQVANAAPVPNSERSRAAAPQRAARS